ncbi:MAG TPA: PepSY-associated TM helix domain-containing protein [Thiobacillus sp.]|nr:PepSY domain-containing protein [Gammaproteobacteria bacterium]OYZ29179.1 MAG: hypothetical protein B7Y27_04620 [Hydrogenophilales bacterium 16-64-40]OZA34531.1 MAG: hypothetical protein B7X82_05720 [Hydrogenophilales bacterium 17-64-65]HQS82859.1 PepSY-associated TM helix domain-containing protein [Thiobacillus sp.]HQT33398.1 PepSY-associated TM helix domain-containing protein [Thiobacillus sp.]
MTARHVVFKLHLYTGLLVGLLMMVSGLTGSVLVFREELDALAQPELLATAQQGERVTVDAVLQTVRRAYPADRPFAIRMPRTPQQTYLVKLNSAHGLFVYVDPHNGSILGAHRQDQSMLGWISLLHTELLAGEAGETALGIGGLLLIGLCVTGLVVWWPRNGKISQGFKIQWPARWKRLNFDLHRVSGIYAALFLLITAATGAAFVFNETAIDLVDAVTASAPRATPPRVESARPGTPTRSLDTLLRQADRALPAPTTWISLPQTPQAPVVVRKKLAQELHPNGRNFVYLDQHSGRVLQLEHALAAPLGTRVFNTFYPLHIGAVAGTPTRVLQVIVGLAPTLLLVTGFVMWKNRRERKR